MRIVTLAFGQDLTHHLQACFCALSFLKEPHPPHISIVTDRPEYFNYFGESIQVVRLDQQKMKRWKGSADFFWRIKIKAIMEIVDRFPGEHVVYVDADTFVAKGLSVLNTDLTERVPVMHEYEGRLREKNQKPYKSMWVGLHDKTFCGIQIDSDSEVWNAGVVGIPGHTSQETIHLALDLCDAMCATDVRRAYIEQFAISLALRHMNGPIKPAKSIIGHYWGNKDQWNEAISSFFLHSLLEKRTLAQDIEEMKAFNYSAIPIRMMGQKKWVKKLQRILTKNFPPKVFRYHPSAETHFPNDDPESTINN